MKRFLSFIFVFLISSAAAAETITVAAAISLKDALTVAAKQYKAQTGEEVEFSFAASGQLASQIQNGAPVDLFISAANKQIEDLSKAGAIDDSTRKVIAGNSLVVIVPPENKSPPDSLKGLAGGKIKRIAIGEPRTVPAGQYAQQAIKHAGIAAAVKDKLVMGANVRQVLDYVERGEVSASLVYATDAKMAGEKVRVAATVDADAHEPIVYPAAVVKASKKAVAAKKFLEFVLSEKGQAALKEFGFSPPPAVAVKSPK